MLIHKCVCVTSYFTLIFAHFGGLTKGYYLALVASDVNLSNYICTLQTGCVTVGT